MAVQVVIRRKFVKEKVSEVAPLMVKLRSFARAQPGYISSETLKCLDPPCEDEHLVRATWQSFEDWKRWLHSEERIAIQQQIDAITGETTEYRVYESLIGGIIPEQSK